MISTSRPGPSFSFRPYWPPEMSESWRRPDPRAGTEVPRQLDPKGGVLYRLGDDLNEGRPGPTAAALACASRPAITTTC